MLSPPIPYLSPLNLTPTNLPSFLPDQGIVSAILIMPHFKSRFPLTPLKKGLLTSILELGAFGGSLTCSSLADRYSRKRTILLGCLIFLVGGLLQALAQEMGVLFLGRAVGGWGVGMLSCLAPLYLSEIAPRRIRGAVLALEQFSIVTGVVVGFWYVLLVPRLSNHSYFMLSSLLFILYGVERVDFRIDYGTRNIDSELSFRLPLLLQLIPATLLAIGTTLLPFSPRWLASQGPCRSQETLQVLSKLRNLPPSNPVLLKEYHEIKVEVELQRGMETSWREMFIGRIRRRTMIGIGVMFFQQFSGINALLYYA